MNTILINIGVIAAVIVGIVFTGDPMVIMGLTPIPLILVLINDNGALEEKIMKITAAESDVLKGEYINFEIGFNSESIK